MQTPGKDTAERERKKNLPGLLKRDTGESDQTSRAIDAMALSTPGQPASRGLDDPGLGDGVPPGAHGGTYRINPRPLTADSATTALLLATAGRETTRCAPLGDNCTCDRQLAAPKTPSCGVRHWEEERRKFLSPLGYS